MVSFKSLGRFYTASDGTFQKCHLLTRHSVQILVEGGDAREKRHAQKILPGKMPKQLRKSLHGANKALIQDHGKINSFKSM